MIDIVVLTLKSTPQRTEYFRKRHSGRIKFTFHYGLDASQIPTADYWRARLTDRVQQSIPARIISPSELTCAKGHRAILSDFVKSRRPADFLVVLEDDVDVPEGTPLLLQEISKTAQDGIVILGGNNGNRRMKKFMVERAIKEFAGGKKLRLIHRLCHRLIWRSCCYMLSYDIAKKLLLSYENYNLLAADWVGRMRCASIDRLYLIEWIDHIAGLSSDGAMLERW